MNTSHSAIRAPHYGIYRHLFELVIKIVCIFATSSLLVQAFATYFANLNTLWQFHVSFSALIIVEAMLMVSWFGVETQHEVPKVLKFASALILLSILALIFMVSFTYTSGDNFTLKGFFLSIIFLRCTISAISVRKMQERKQSKAEAILELKVRSKQKQRLLTLNHMIRCEQMNAKQRAALTEIEQLKKHLIRRAHAKHLLAMAQIHSTLAESHPLHEVLQTEQEELVVS